MTTPSIISLAALLAPLPSVDLGEAGVHQVKPITGVGMQLLEESRVEGRWQALFAAAALCVPTLDEGAIFTCTVAQVEAIINIASGQAAQVMTAVGNASAPSPGTATAPDLPIPSAS